MHAYFFIRAINHDRKQFIQDLEAQYFPYTYYKDGNKINGSVQLSVREWGGFYEFVFPEEAYDDFMSMIGDWDDYTKAQIKYKSIIAIFRQALGLTKFKKHTEKPKRITWRTTHPDIRMIGIGIRKDKYDSNGVELL